MSLFSELKRRNVLRVAIGYLAAAWLLIQIVETLFPVFELSDASIRLVVILLVIGFPIVVILAWVYEWTPEGVMLERDIDRSASATHHTGKRLDRAIIVVLAISLGYFAIDKFVLDPARDRELERQSRLEGAKQAQEEARLAVGNKKSIAVLPFTTLSTELEDEFLSIGLHEELLTRMFPIADLTVIASTSVESYRDTDKSFPVIGDELSVANVMVATLRRSGGHIRVNVRLINAQTEELMWAEKYDEEVTAENLFAIQTSITSSIVEALDAELSPAAEARVYELPTASLEAYNHFMRGRRLMAERHTDDLRQALGEFENAARIDPEFALAWVGIANTRRYLNQRNADSPDSMRFRNEAIDRALALNDQLGEAYVSRSYIRWEEGQPEESLADCMKGIELSPNYWRGYMQCGAMIGRKGPASWAQRLEMYLRAGQLDPLSLSIQNTIGRVFTGLGRYDEAQEQFEHMLQLDPDFVPTYASVRELHERQGNLAEAVKWGREALKRDPENGLYRRDLAQLYFSLDDLDSVERHREEMRTHMDPENWEFSWLEWNTDFALGTPGEIPATIDKLPASFADQWYILALKANAQFLSENFEAARDYWLDAESRWGNPENWGDLINTNQTSMDRLHACKFASILIKLDDEVRGRDLLEQATYFSAITLPGLVEDSHTSPSLGWCYLAADSFDKAFDFYKGRVAHGHIADWWKEKNLPWWNEVRDHPRYIELVNNIEGKLQEQRDIIGQMEN